MALIFKIFGISQIRFALILKKRQDQSFLSLRFDIVDIATVNSKKGVIFNKSSRLQMDHYLSAEGFEMLNEMKHRGLAISDRTKIVEFF